MNTNIRACGNNDNLFMVFNQLDPIGFKNLLGLKKAPRKIVGPTAFNIYIKNRFKVLLHHKQLLHEYRNQVHCLLHDRPPEPLI